MKPHHLLLLIPGVILFACSRQESPPPEAAAPSSPAAVAEPATATATMAGKSGSQVTGTLRFTTQGDGVVVSGELQGLASGTEHGFHIHEQGDCSAPDAATAGGHLNPGQMPHGNPTEAGPTAHHLGDMPNVVADNTGRAAVNAFIAGATLGDGGSNDLIGKAVIVHAQRDDYMTQPSGDAGARIACGVIE